MPANLGHAVRKLRLRHLELLALLGTEPSVRAAARRMALTQPAVSALLQEVERCFGTALFERSQSGVAATAAGRRLIAYATNVVNGLRAAADEVDAVAHGASGTLRVGTFSVIPSVPRAVVALRAELPTLRVQIREGTAAATLRALADGELDCVVGAVPPEALGGEHLDGLRFDTLGADHLCVMAAPSHRLARRRTLHWSDLGDVPWVLAPKASMLRLAVIDAFVRAGLQPPEAAVEVLSPVTIADLLASDTTLVGPMRVEQAQAEVAARRLRVLPVSPRRELPPIALITRRPPAGGSDDPTAPTARLRAALAGTAARAGSRAAPPPRPAVRRRSG